MFLDIGSIIDDRYTITGVIGTGGMGVVYAALQIDLKRTVALKMSSLAATDEMLARFYREARILSVLEQPNIVKFFAYGKVLDQPYIAMELVENAVDLKTWANQQGRTVDEILEAFCIITEALAYAHTCGVIHRDLKPLNVLIPTEFIRKLKIVDFGLGKLGFLKEDQAYTETGQLIGTPLYMSPEFLSGCKPDARSDIYAVGCMLFECLSGQPPFTADSPIAIIYRHQSSVRPSLPNLPLPQQQIDVLNQLIGKAMAVDPDQRLESMEVFRQHLQDIRQGRTPQFLDGPPDSASIEPRFLLLTGLLIMTFLISALPLIAPTNLPACALFGEGKTYSAYLAVAKFLVGARQVELADKLLDQYQPNSKVLSRNNSIAYGCLRLSKFYQRSGNKSLADLWCKRAVSSVSDQELLESPSLVDEFTDVLATTEGNFLTETRATLQECLWTKDFVRMTKQKLKHGKLHWLQCYFNSTSTNHSRLGIERNASNFRCL